MNKLTLAVAAYRVSPFITECLESIRAQTNQDFDLLVIDDGSPDDTGKKVDAFAAAYPKLRVLHQQNAGIACVRNRMIELCQTEYLWTIDGDDSIAKDSVAQLLPTLDGVREEVCFSYTNYGTRPVARTGKLYDLTPALLNELRYKSMCRSDEPLLQGINANCSVMCVYRVDFLRARGLAFEPGRTVGEDALFASQFFAEARHVAYLDAPLYLYRVNEGSVSLRYQDGLAESSAEWLELVGNFVDEKYPNDERMRGVYRARVLSTLAGGIAQLDLCHPDNKKPYAQRRARFLAIAARPRIDEAIRCCPRSAMSRNVKLYAPFFRLRWFFVVNLIARVIMKKRYMVFNARGGKKKA